MKQEPQILKIKEFKSHHFYRNIHILFWLCSGLSLSLELFYPPAKLLICPQMPIPHSLYLLLPSSFLHHLTGGLQGSDILLLAPPGICSAGQQRCVSCHHTLPWFKQWLVQVYVFFHSTLGLFFNIINLFWGMNPKVSWVIPSEQRRELFSVKSEHF